MAINRKYPQTKKKWPKVVVVAEDARASNIAKSGDPVLCGNKPGVALNDADTAGKTVMQVDGMFDLLVAGIDSGGTSAADRNVAVNGGDKVYFDKTKAPPLSKRTGGTYFGIVVGDSGVQQIASGATDKTCLVEVGG